MYYIYSLIYLLQQITFENIQTITNNKTNGNNLQENNTKINFIKIK